MGCISKLIDVLFNRVFPLISMAFTIGLALWLFRNRDIMGPGTMNLIRQVKSWWGTDQVNKRWDKRDKTASYKSGQVKVSEKLKAIAPLCILDDLTPEEIHEYLLNEDTINFLMKAKAFLGDLDIKIPGVPKQLGGRGKDEMRPE